MTKKDFIILSAELDIFTDANNQDRTNRLERMLKSVNANYKKVHGVYKGKGEIAFLVTFETNLEYDMYVDFAFKNFAQESVLIRDGKEIYLRYNSKTYGHKIQTIGTEFKCVPFDIAHENGAYTYTNGLYYIAQ